MNFDDLETQLDVLKAELEIIEDLLIRDQTEILMWRQRELDNMLFVDSAEESYFSELLLNHPSGIEDFEDFAELTLERYRDARGDL